MPVSPCHLPTSLLYLSSHFILLTSSSGTGFVSWLYVLMVLSAVLRRKQMIHKYPLNRETLYS